jgi:hypothetical protein
MKIAVLNMVRVGIALDPIMQATGLRKIEVLRFCGEAGFLEMLMANGRTPRKQTVGRVRRQRAERRKVPDEQLRSMIAAGKRPKQIAIECGVTHQAIYARIRQDGIVLPPKPRKKDLPKMSKKYGLPMDVVLHLRSMGATSAFTRQKQNAKNRGIEWGLTFSQWWDLWESSGKWDLRGKYKGGYVMGRHGDEGPYAVGNVVICTHRENVMEREKHSPAFGRLQKRSDLSMDMR